MWKLGLMLLLITSCDAEKPMDAVPSAATSSGAAPSIAEPRLCDAAQLLRKRLAPIDVNSSRAPVEPGMVLPESKDGKRAPEGSVVSFAKASMTINGQPAATPGAVADAVNERGGRPVLFALGKDDEDMGRVSAVAEAIGADAEIYLLASPPGAKREPAPAALKKELEGLRSGERAGVLANALRAAIKDCKPAADLFQSLASESLPEERAGMLKERLPLAVNDCACKVGSDLPDLAAYVLGGDSITVAKRLVFANDGKTIALKGLKGQALYDALPADGGAIRFEK